MVQPEFTPEAIMHYLSKYDFQVNLVEELPSYIDQNFLITTDSGKYVLKIANSDESPLQLEMENQLMMDLQGKSDLFELPELVPLNGQAIFTIAQEDQIFPCRMVTHLPGKLLSELSSPVDPWIFGRFIGEVQRLIRGFNHPNLDRHLRWDILRSNEIISENIGYVQEPAVRECIEYFQNLFEKLEVQISSLPQNAVHNDANDNNVLFDPMTSKFGLIDFGDMIRSIRISELVIGTAYYIIYTDEPLQTIKEIIRGYYSVLDISNNEIKYFLLLIALRYSVSICISSRDISNNPNNEYILVSQQSAIRMLDYFYRMEQDQLFDWMELDYLIDVDDSTLYDDLDDLLEKRRLMTSEALSLSYQSPLTIVRGRMQYLYDKNQLAYLDLVNNVAIVGHSNPFVIKKMSQQASFLNTNTRYLHRIRIEYFNRLKKTLPDKFQYIFYVNSGTEANELAIRLAKSFSGSSSFVVLEDAYHGNSNAVIDISPYKFLGEGGTGKPEHITILPRADTLRGQYTGDQAIAQYLQKAEDIISALDNQIAGFVFEPVMGVAGQFFPPSEYLRKICSLIKQRDGLCIADEVQIGFGRLGSHFWGFQYQNLESFIDIITIGKPIGNGFPIGAVITTKEVADRFATGMEYFNTFGGNPLSVAVADAVLQYIVDHQLQQSAEEIGQYLLVQLKKLRTELPILADIRGSGLFIGVELLDDANQPLTELAANLIEEMKNQHILLSTDGPDNNVLKIKPPLVLRKYDVDKFVHNLRMILRKISE